MFCGGLLRFCYLIALPILFHRLRDSMTVAEGNVALLSEFATFNSISMQCGDPLAVLDLEKSTSYMLSASSSVTKSYWFTLSAIILICTEIILLCFLPCLIKCKDGCESKSRQSELQESLINPDYIEPQVTVN
jgi:hypothetical protein